MWPCFHVVTRSPVHPTPILRRIFAALRSGGKVVIVDSIVDDGRSGPASALLFNLTMLLLSEDGKSYERGELTDLLRESGFGAPTFAPTDDMSTLVVAAKP